LKRYDTRPKTVMNPPSVAHTMLKFVRARIGIIVAVQDEMRR
jgi:hypothetical protein